ncbi:hypothetical protein VP01_11447g1, partial [Puccinia sorghi]
RKKKVFDIGGDDAAERRSGGQTGPAERQGVRNCEPGAELFIRKWAATFGRVIYLDLQEAMLHHLKATNSKFTLIHDV